MSTATAIQTSEVPGYELPRHNVQYKEDQSRNIAFTQLPDAHSYNALSTKSITRRIWTVVAKFLYALVPQLVRSVLWRDKVKESKRFSTAYFNGLRGICAVKVYTFHYMYAHSRATSKPWGSGPQYHHFLELPIIRWLFAGSTSHIFFGVGGYLMSVRLLQLMEKGDQASQAKLFATIATSLFRRIFRLYLPLAAMTLFTSLCIYLGLFEYTRSYTTSPKRRHYFAGGGAERIAPQMPTLRAQLTHWAQDFYHLTNIWNVRPFYSSLDPHLWSLPYELRASLHLYVCLLVVGLCRTQVRLGLLLLFVAIYFYWNRWEMWVFLLGAVVAQIDVMLPSVQPRHDPFTLHDPDGAKEGNGMLGERPRSLWRTKIGFRKMLRASRSRARLFNLIVWGGLSRALLYLLAFFFLTYPLCCYSAAPGYVTINQLIPRWMDRKDKFYSNIGTALLIFLLCRANPATSQWQKLLNSRIPQYLGKISFSIYLCHGPVLNIIGFLLPNMVWWGMGIDGVPASMRTWSFGIIMGWAIGLMLVLWAADVWTREVEARCVKVVKRLEDYCFRKT